METPIQMGSTMSTEKLKIKQFLEELPASNTEQLLIYLATLEYKEKLMKLYAEISGQGTEKSRLIIAHALNIISMDVDDNDPHAKSHFINQIISRLFDK
jgi:hypothetical protein